MEKSEGWIKHFDRVEYQHKKFINFQNEFCRNSIVQSSF